MNLDGVYGCGYVNKQKSGNKNINRKNSKACKIWIRVLHALLFVDNVLFRYKKMAGCFIS